MRRLAIAVLLLLLACVPVCHLASRGRFGEPQTGGEVTAVRWSEAAVAEREARQRWARARVGPDEPKQILFGDLHAHTTFSFDAYAISLPMYQGEGSHPPADACDFARFCAGLDFWSINDHAEGLTPRQWAETKQSVRQCNAVAGDPRSPDLVTFLGWEWTQIGRTPDDHYGHKNVVLRDTAEADVPARPISSREELFPGGGNPYSPFVRLALIAAAPGSRGRGPYHDFARFLQERTETPRCAKGARVRSLPADCQESAETPRELFAKLDDWGFPHLVIPHGNTWGFYTPPRSSWDQQLRDHDDVERREPLIEVFSGHGNIESYRSWRAVDVGADGTLVCPEPRPDYTPECWRAGEIIEARCLAAGESPDACRGRAAEARAAHVAAGIGGHLTVPGAALEDWLDAGQCRDCYMPAYDHRPGGSVQYALALSDFGDASVVRRFRFGLIGSSDVHTGRPGTGYKEGQRRRMTDAGLGLMGVPAALLAKDPAPRAIPPEDLAYTGPYFERFASFFGTGGLAAVHAAGRDRDSIWDALQRKEVYATSGDRILLWFDLVEEGPAGEARRSWPMGSSVRRSQAPSFEVRAVGAFVQQPGCPPDAASALTASRLERLCGGECYHPSDSRKRIDRIEVVRIRPQRTSGEPVADLIEDPWRVLPCPEGEDGCLARFSDPDFVEAARDAVYYVRAIEEASPTVNAGQLRCTTDESGRCVSVNPCRASEPTPYEDDCLTAAEERAWSSPIFVDFAAADG